MSKRKKEGEEEVNTYTYILVLSSIYPCSALFKGRSCLRFIVKRKVIVCEWIIFYFYYGCVVFWSPCDIH